MISKMIEYFWDPKPTPQPRVAFNNVRQMLFEAQKTVTKDYLDAVERIFKMIAGGDVNGARRLFDKYAAKPKDDYERMRFLDVMYCYHRSIRSMLSSNKYQVTCRAPESIYKRSNDRLWVDFFGKVPYDGA